MVERNGQPFQNMRTRFRLGKFILRPARDDIFLMGDIVMENLLEVQDFRLAVDQRKHDDAEAVLQLRMLVELI